MDTKEHFDKIHETLGEIKVTLAVNTASLQEHIKRTNILEDEIKPIKAHVAVVSPLLKIAVAVATAVAIRYFVK